MKAEGIGWGKLYIAGEYAVVHPGHPAIILATQRCIRASIQSSQQFSLKNVNNGLEIVFNDLNHTEEYWKYALSALKVFYRFLEEKEHSFSPVCITLESDLDSEDGLKLGLGSSGAVVAAIIKGLNKYYQCNLDLLSQYKLCVISQIELQVSGSFGDLAAAVFGDIIHYTRFADFDRFESISKLITMDWPLLSIAYLDWPFDLHWVVGWTGHPASTKSHVEWINRFKDDIKYGELLNKAKIIVNDMINCRSTGEFLEGIRRYRTWLNQLEKLTRLNIETSLIRTFIEICFRYEGIAKSSGAGGGDCAIAFFTHPVNISDILLSVGIMPLTITIAKREVV
jgi:phosphomevalonate kinase